MVYGHVYIIICIYITTKIVKYIQYDIRTRTPYIQEVAQLLRI